jgi:hypothetical protein
MPKAFANFSPGLERKRQPWDRDMTDESNPEGVPKPTNAFIVPINPNVSLIKLNTVRIEKRPILVLKRHALVMRLLVLDIPNDIGEIRLTHGKCCIPALPVKLGKFARCLLDPTSTTHSAQQRCKE